MHRQAPAPAPPTTRATEASPSSRRRQLVIGAVVVAGLLLAGYWVGLGSSWSAHRPVVETVRVHRMAAEIPYATLMHDGHQVGFRLDDVTWRSADSSDGGGTVPSCLRSEGSSATVEVGMIEVARPFGSGSYWQVLSLTCPG